MLCRALYVRNISCRRRDAAGSYKAAERHYVCVAPCDAMPWWALQTFQMWSVYLQFPVVCRPEDVQGADSEDRVCALCSSTDGGGRFTGITAAKV